MNNRNRTGDVLFLCTDNYYRSRFAENFFNWLASIQELDFWAESRGLQINPLHVGPISRYAVKGLNSRGIDVAEPFRHPTPVLKEDFDYFNTIIALKESEHRPVIESRFTDRCERVEYWSIDNIDACEPETALLALENKIRHLLSRLQMPVPNRR